MEKENLLRTGFYGVVGLLGGSLGQLFGGFDTLFWALLTCSIIDYFSGGAVAIIFKNSPKTETGGAKSRIGFKGLVKKIFIYMLVVVAVQMDIVLKANGFIRNAVIIGFMANEILSIIENVGLMGINLPKPFVDAVDILKKKSEGKEEGDNNAK
ncbi:phage holin family protein [Clostridium ihumii]|uniref:phage holin family protein n=1 Tax=Clostridium ihumii TaxID=1470356 RepID=UPI003D32D7CB